MSEPKPASARRSNAALPLPNRIAGGWRHFSTDEIERLHRLYYDPKVRVSKISAAFGVSTSTLLRWIDEMDWPCRRQMKRDAIDAMRNAGRGLRADAPSNAAFGAAASDAASRAHEAAYAARIGEGLDRLEQSVAPTAPDPEPEPAADIDPNDFGALCEAVGEVALRELARARARTGADASAQNARTLASLTRTLSTLDDLRKRRGLKPGQTAEPERPARSIAELRADIARRLEIALGRNSQASE